MKVYDISQELFTCALFPGDKHATKVALDSIKDGSICNATSITMASHHGTHVDAPKHFYDDGKTIDELDIYKLVGKCYVAFEEGPVTKEKAQAIIDKARLLEPESAKRILIGGEAFVTIDAAKVFTKEGVELVGNESQTVGPLEGPAEVHYELLGKEVILLEGIRLEGVKEGMYLLSAAPVKMGGLDGAPCRAILIEE